MVRHIKYVSFTNDETRLIEFVTKAKNTSWGDVEEFYELVIKKIVEETNWREGSIKAVLLIADSEPHRVGYHYGNKVVNNQIDWREEARKAAEKGIKFDTVTINKTEWYKELSKITNGVSAPFSTSLKTSQLIEAVALARGGERTRDLYKTTMDSFEASGDIEMTAVYAAYSIVFEHLESKKTISLSNEYVHNMLNTSDQYEIEVKVTREDKKDGTPGIRTIFKRLQDAVCF